MPFQALCLNGFFPNIYHGVGHDGDLSIPDRGPSLTVETSVSLRKRSDKCLMAAETADLVEALWSLKTQTNGAFISGKISITSSVGSVNFFVQKCQIVGRVCINVVH